MKRQLAWLVFLLAVPALGAEDLPLQLDADQGFYHRDGLKVWVGLVHNPDSFLREWRDPVVPGSPRVLTRTSFYRGDIVLPAILFQTDGLTADGRADIRYRMEFRRPDGTVYEKFEDKVVIDGIPPKGVGLFEEMMGLKIENDDPFGAYTLTVEVTDRVKNVTVTMPFTFTVTDPEVERLAVEAVESERDRAGEAAEMVGDRAGFPASGKSRVRSAVTADPTVDYPETPPVPDR
ncbi:MAG: hypothetical protein SFU53_11960 [Terrimicrobiaceae bacterium]|nr:hypothetical protein [Terrimicrobiaceae bacterium]